MRDKEEKRPDSISPDKWPKFKERRDEFKEAFKDADNDKINEILNAHPDNIRPEDDNNPERRFIEWKDCPLHMTASYYASNKLEIVRTPIPEIEELKLLLAKQ